MHMHQELEARVGIAQGFYAFLTSPKPFGSGYFSKCCTGKEIITGERANQVSKQQLTPTIFCRSEHF